MLDTFWYVYGWKQGEWPQKVWEKLHKMLQAALMDSEGRNIQDVTAYRLTEYPAPGDGDISRETAVEKARIVLEDSRAALDEGGGRRNR